MPNHRPDPPPPATAPRSPDAELAARIERIPGITAVRLAVAETPRLALVS
jgi:hypothetical protein